MIPRPQNITSIVNKYIPNEIRGIERINLISMINVIIESTIAGDKEIDECVNDLKEIFSQFLDEENVNKAIDEIIRAIKIERAIRVAMMKGRRKFTV
ncbi:MAG: hypothetical protein DRP11_00880 [Candidatus Aenigmatarchaeota archaeon]|nr:MAG: hypothetical protein DRP11_00880 [Candidatus Aenigmarchaeota archaeon]